MQSADIFLRALITVGVFGFAWLAARPRTLRRTLLWALVAAFVPVLLVNIILSQEMIKAEAYWYWDVSSFLIKSLSAVIFTGILFFGSSLSSWVVSVRWKKPMWLGIVSGVVTALILYVPAAIAGLLVACLSGDCL